MTLWPPAVRYHTTRMSSLKCQQSSREKPEAAASAAASPTDSYTPPSCRCVITYCALLIFVACLCWFVVRYVGIPLSGRYTQNHFNMHATDANDAIAYEQLNSDAKFDYLQTIFRNARSQTVEELAKKTDETVLRRHLYLKFFDYYIKYCNNSSTKQTPRQSVEQTRKRTFCIYALFKCLSNEKYCRTSCRTFTSNNVPSHFPPCRNCRLHLYKTQRTNERAFSKSQRKRRSPDEEPLPEMVKVALKKQQATNENAVLKQQPGAKAAQQRLAKQQMLKNANAAAMETYAEWRKNNGYGKIAARWGRRRRRRSLD